MGLRSLPTLLIQTVNGLIATRARVLQIDTASMTLVQNADNSLTLGATGGGGGNVATDAIWDAKGDLAVGTGADTAAKLTVGTDGQALVADSAQTTGVKWADTPGTGTVTSVAATVPTGFSVSGSPVTTSGTLAVTLNTQTANKVLASATSGGSATPDFRALVAADIPAIAESGVTSLVTDLGLKAPIANPTFTGVTTAPEFSASGLTGATAASRYVGSTASGAPVSGTFVLGDWISDQTGKRWTCTVGGTPGTWAQEPGTGGGGGGGLYSAVVIVEDQKTSGTDGGTFTSGAWRTRDLNTKVADSGSHASVASNQITLDAGTYDCIIRAPAFHVDRHQARLEDTTGNATLLTGGGGFTSASVSVQTDSLIMGRFTLSVQSVLEIQHQCATTQAVNGFGVGAGGSFTVAHETYTSATFWKV